MKRVRTHWKRSLGRLLSLCALVVVIFHTGQVGAQPDPAPRFELPVTRAAGAEQCPDGAALATRVAAVRGSAAAPTSSPYRVDFTQEGGLYSATIRRVDDDQLARVLSARGDSCDALAQACSVTLALLLDTLVAAPAAAPSVKPTAAASPEPAPDRPAASQERPATPMQLQAALGGAALLGVTRDVSPALLGELALARGHVRIGLGALWVPPMRADFGPGSLRSTLWSATLRACFRSRARGRASTDGAAEGHAWQLWLCGGWLAGAIEVSARGYTRNERDTRPWLAVPVEASFAFLPGPVGIQVGLGALFPVQRHDFSIDGLGPGYASWPVSALLSLQVLAAFPRAARVTGAKN